jgi:hypothetical protein
MTKAMQAAKLGETLSGRRRHLTPMGEGFTPAQESSVEQHCQMWLDSWVIDQLAELLPAGKIRDAFLREANNREVPADIARYRAAQLAQRVTS